MRTNLKWDELEQEGIYGAVSGSSRYVFRKTENKKGYIHSDIHYTPSNCYDLCCITNSSFMDGTYYDVSEQHKANFDASEKAGVFTVGKIIPSSYEIF